MQQQRPQSPNIHQTTYDAVRRLARQLEPVTKLVQGTDSPNAVDPIATIIELLSQTVTGIDRILARLEALEARLDDATVMNAIKSSVHG